jgi:hypothetical protein
MKKIIKNILIFMALALVIAMSILIPYFPLWVLEIKFTVLHYVYSALGCCAIMIIFLLINISTNKKIKNENGEQSN